ncbi:hypothetical protein EMA8858_00157 [Emticicia aquatica]|jgi:hypothetical protein|uniref:Single-stranded DNA-binding protein n=1 Tax=Emticicia aquatica TaxID=1681835 RepID=A0ABM9AJZ4_9BACT|nr:hypothetical protein [Emticicia aquatica]CAH0994050.1 hypothetical protein EMA8858_00157 [Emticicia aquatica]
MKEKIRTAGSFFVQKEVEKHVGKHVEHIKGKKASSDVFHDEDGQIRRAELFGKEVITKLLNNSGGKEVFGIRIYYGHAPEDKDGNIKEGGKLRPRLFLVPVDENGKDIPFDASALKGEPNGNAVGGGLPCPQACNE